jgi:hypothetical protein
VSARCTAQPIGEPPRDRVPRPGERARVAPNQCTSGRRVLPNGAEQTRRVVWPDRQQPTSGPRDRSATA